MRFKGQFVRDVDTPTYTGTGTGTLIRKSP